MYPILSKALFTNHLVYIHDNLIKYILLLFTFIYKEMEHGEVKYLAKFTPPRIIRAWVGNHSLLPGGLEPDPQRGRLFRAMYGGALKGCLMGGGLVYIYIAGLFIISLYCT